MQNPERRTFTMLLAIPEKISERWRKLPLPAKGMILGGTIGLFLFGPSTSLLYAAGGGALLGSRIKK